MKRALGHRYELRVSSARDSSGPNEADRAIPLSSSRRPTKSHISDGVIAFESLNIADPTPNYDIYIYDLATNLLYRQNNTALLDESLNDISVVGNRVRVTWSVSESADWNVYAREFELNRARIDAPGEVILSVEAGSETKQAIYLTNIGRSDLTIKSVDLAIGSDPELTLSSLELPDVLTPEASLLFFINFRPNHVGGFGATLNIKSSDPARPILTIPVTGFGR